jgi:hypothetical protein
MRDQPSHRNKLYGILLYDGIRPIIPGSGAGAATQDDRNLVSAIDNLKRVSGPIAPSTYVSSVRQEVPTGRENRFQRLSYSGTYRVTHRRIVLWATMTPRSAIIPTRSR